MRKQFFIAFLAAWATIPISVAYASNMLPFGGQIEAEYTCNDGLLLYIAEPTGFTALLWHYGELPYNYHVAPHLYQNILGWYQTSLETCTLGSYTIGAGFPIITHGDSL